MIAWLRYQKTIMGLDRQRKALRKTHALQWAANAADPKSGPDQEHFLGFTHYEEMQTIEDGIRHEASIYLVERAERLLLPIPSGDAMWDYSHLTGLGMLRPEALVALRKAIREEQAARRDASLSWFAAGTGLVGALTGLFAVLMSGN